MQKLTSALFAAMILTTPADAAELVLFEFDGCFHCEQWKKDVGRYYANTAEGKNAPLRVIDLFDTLPQYLRTIRPVRATPTFVLIDDGKEIGRIVGFTGAKDFWVKYGQILDRN